MRQRAPIIDYAKPEPSDSGFWFWLLAIGIPSLCVLLTVMWLAWEGIEC